MAFQKPNQVPERIATITVILVDHRSEDEPDVPIRSVMYRLVVEDQDGNRIEFPQDQGNLVPHLTSQEITQLQTFMTSLRQRAETAIL